MKKSGSTNRKTLIKDVVQPPPIRSQTFASAYPEGARQWHYKKNCGFGPDDFSYGSMIKAWFKCPAAKDHIFQISIKDMSRSLRNGSWTQGCTFCRGFKPSVSNSVADQYPELANEWMVRKTGFGPESVSFGSNVPVWWKCKKGHIWQAIVASRTSSGYGCWICNKGTPVDLRDFPEVLKQFDYKKNRDINPFAIVDKTKIAWRCTKDPTHEGWVAAFTRKTSNNRCPSCLNRRGSKNNNIKISHPEIAKQWDKVRNGNLKPQMVTQGSHKRVFWKCDKGPDHEWSARVVDRTKDGTKCPFCSNRKSSVTNVLTTLSPKLAAEWHPTKNGKMLPSQERARSQINRWWRCIECSHEWLAQPAARYMAKNSRCPSCKYKG